MNEFLTKKEFETWKRAFENRKSIGAILSTLLCQQAVGFIKPLFIYGTFTGGSATVTYTKPFKAGTTPSVVTATNNSMAQCIVAASSNTATTLQVKNTATGLDDTATVYWIAAGIVP